MTNKFPKIERMSDVSEFYDSEFFTLNEKEIFGHKVKWYNYHVIFSDTFNSGNSLRDSVVQEFRGITFCSKTGKLLRRPLHKFFNLNEIPSTFELNFKNGTYNYNDYMAMDKVDGSMICPIIIGNDIFWGTGNLATEFHDYVEEFLIDSGKKDEYKLFVNMLSSSGHSPIFEFTSKHNRIVLDYKKPDLKLLHIRNKKTGQYVNPKNIDKLLGDTFTNISVCHIYKKPFDSTLVQKLSKMSDIEGIVIFNKGHMIKIKTEWYCNLHKIKESLSNEHKTIEIILDGKMDDLLSLVNDDDDYDYVLMVEKMIENLFHSTYHRILHLASQNLSKKDLGLSDEKHLIKTVMFSCWDNLSEDNIKDMIFSVIRKNLTTLSKWQKFKEENYS